MQESPAETGKCHQEATEIRTGLLKAIGPAGLASLWFSAPSSALALWAGGAAAQQSISKASTQGLPHLILSFQPCLLEEGK